MNALRYEVSRSATSINNTGSTQMRLELPVEFRVLCAVVGLYAVLIRLRWQVVAVR